MAIPVTIGWYQQWEGDSTSTTRQDWDWPWAAFIIYQKHVKVPLLVFPFPQQSIKSPFWVIRKIIIMITNMYIRRISLNLCDGIFTIRTGLQPIRHGCNHNPQQSDKIYQKPTGHFTWSKILKTCRICKSAVIAPSYWNVSNITQWPSNETFGHDKLINEANRFFYNTVTKLSP